MAAGALWVVFSTPKTPVPKDRENDTIVQYWEKWTGVEEISMQQIVDDFNNTVGKEKHIYVQMLSMSDIDQKTLVATAAGVPPDVAGLWDPTIVQLGTLGSFSRWRTWRSNMGSPRGITSPSTGRGATTMGICMP